MPPDTEQRASPPHRPHPSRALYAATALGALGGVVLCALFEEGGFAPVLPVRQAQAQQAPAQQPGTEPAAAPPAATGDSGQPRLTTAAPSAADAVAGGALGVLLEQARYWRSRQRYDQAINSLDRALSLAPDNPDALALMVQVQSEKGDQQAAGATLDRLRKVAPGDPRIVQLAQAILVGQITPDQLAGPRHLAQSGKSAEAIEQYNKLFKGNPPPDPYSIEYYQTLAGTEHGYDQAREGLARLVRQDPRDLRVQLAYAQVLTYRDAARLEGIERLAALSQSAPVADQATEAWRRALGWLPDSQEAIAPLETFLATHPGDAEITAKLEQARNPPQTVSAPARARIAGFDALNKGNLADAEKLFRQAIDADATDADATGGLGIVRLRLRDFAGAKLLLARAIALDPQHRARWQSALAAASNPGGGANPAVALINRGDFAAAQRELIRQAARGDDIVGLQAMLADAEARRGRLEEAEATFRSALSRAPNNAQVMLGLAGVLARERRNAESLELLDRAQTVGGNGRLIGQARALQLREQAGAAQDPATRLGLYRAAVAADPQNPWVRLDLARALVKLGQTDEARRQMAAVTGANPSPDGLKAGIIFANETSDPDAAAALIARLPPKLRTADMRAAMTQARLQGEVRAALMLSRPEAVARLLAMSALPDPDGARGAALARALGGIGDKMSAREAVIAAQASTPGQGAAAKLRYAGALLAIGDATGAQDMLAQIGSLRGLGTADRHQLAQLQAGLAVRASDRLNEQGKQADAYDRLAPVLARQPQNPDLNLALARLYQGAKNPREALQIAESMLRRDPGNVEARKGAIEAALQLGDRRHADELAQEGQQLAPNDPKTWMMAADVAKAQGNNGEALRDLERARGLRLQQLGYAGADTGADTAPQPGVSLSPGAPPDYQPVNPLPPAYRQTPLPNADGGADMPQSLAVPPDLQPAPTAADAGPVPMPPFTPQPMTALGVWPTYRPVAASVADPAPEHKLLDTSASDVVPPRPAGGDAAAASPGDSGDRGTNLAPPPQSPPSPFPRPADQAQAAAPEPDQPASEQQQPLPAQYAPPEEPAPRATPPYRPPPAAPPPQPISPFATSPFASSPPPAAERPDGGYYANPFRPGFGGAQAQTEVPALPAAAPDAETEQIDRDIEALRDTVAPSVQAGFGYRDRSGSSGLDALTDLTFPMEATFSPHGYGQLKLAVTPNLLSSGSIGGDVTNQQRFGTGALGLRTNAATGVTTLASPAPGDQNAQGVGLSVAYSLRNFAADVGSSPLGFREQNAVGGVEWAPQLSDHVRLRLKAERRALPDSILSFAGTVDPRTGQAWGGVVQDHARATLEFSAGRADFYALGGYAALTGTHVQNNNEVEAGAGGSFPVWRTDTQEARLGLDLIYFGFAHNQDFFTLGQGGYFSPQSFASALVPLNYKEQVDEDLRYELGGAAGFASFRENAQPYYPIDPALEAALIAQQAGSAAVPGVLTEFPSNSQSGFSGTAHALVDYRVTPSLHVGGKLNYAHSPAFDETIGLVYAKYLFNGADNP